MSTNNRNRIVFPAEFGDLRPQLAPAVQGGEAIYTLYLVYQDGTPYPIPAGATFEVVYQDTSDDATYTTSAGITAADADAGIVTWSAAAALGLSGSFWLSLKVNDDVSLRVKWKIEAALDVSGAVPPVALTTLTAAQAALVVAIQALTGLVKMAAGTATGIAVQSFMETFLSSATAIAARINLLPSYTGNEAKVLAVNATANDVEWVAQSGGGGASDVDDLTTDTGATGSMVRVAPLGGLEYRTVSQVLADIGAETAGAAATVQGNLDTHTGNTSNPHSVTASQAGALATANNLSELTATQATARANIGAGTGNGDVTGPASSTANGIPTFSGTGGKTLQSNAATLSDLGGSDGVTINGVQTIRSNSTSAIRLARGSSGVLLGTFLTDSGTLTETSGFKWRNHSGINSWYALASYWLGYEGNTWARIYGDGFLTRKITGITGSATTVYANGTGDVTLVLSGTFTVSDGAGNVAGGVITATAPSGTFNLYDDGGTNTCQLQVAADGSVTVIRTAGSRTYAVNLNLNWM